MTPARVTKSAAGMPELVDRAMPARLDTVIPLTQWAGR
jgi:hypothetical protein